METIQLNKSEKIWILLCKGWIMKEYPINKAQTFLDYIKPYFSDVYGWSADDCEDDFQRCIFNVLFEILMKIRYSDRNNADLKDIISSACFPLLGNDSENPICRIIQAVKSEIACNTVQNRDGSKRYDLSDCMNLFIVKD